ncbi:nSTAND1 domain-containing NTPase [Nostoc sp.]|uniref:nSTAND1 domain-containing NTPase n=1 Tax=Nostoc sp. TaxID=1180 RepID=UPI002FFB9629
MARYALVLGIAKYDNFSNLPKAINDAEHIAQLLREQGRFDVQPLPGKLIESENRWQIAPDKKLTGKELGQALRIFLLEKAKGAEALIYFAGHGFEAPSLTGEAKGYLATSDCHKDGQNAIAFDDLNTLIAKSQLSSLVVLLDCCYAGSLLERSFIKSGFSVFNNKQDYSLITASRAFERAREDAEGGIFTKAILKGLAEDKADEATGEINVNDLMSFISRELKGSGQEPIYMGGGRSIPLVWYPPKHPVALAVVSEECPYRGLQAFDKEHAKFFFGRQEVVSLIQQKLAQANFIPIIGASGSGKSSVVRAGLIPVLEKNGWRILEPILPGIEPLAELKRAFTQLFERTEIREISALIDTEGLSTVISRLTGSERCLLVVDQFEEIFTLGSQEEERQRFIELLTQISEGQLAVVTTMRADFLEYCLNYKSLTQLIQDQAVYMPPLLGAELEEAIASPASSQGYKLQMGLLGAIQQEVLGQEKGCLPLLQFALTELWEQREQQTHQLTVAKFNELGGVIGTLNRHAEKLYANFTKQQQPWVQQIFLKLVRTGAEDKDTRQRQPKQELLSLAGDNSDEQQVINQVIEKLILGRLIVTYTEAREEVWIDLAHEALIEGWQTFAQWRQRDRDLRRLSDRLADALREWLNKRKNEKYLMQGGLLAEVRENWEKLEFLSSPEAKNFYQCSDAYEQHQIATLEKALTESRLREKAARVENLLLFQPLDSLVLAIQAMGENLEKLPQQILAPVQESLNRVTSRARVSIPFRGHEGSISSVAISADGQTIVSGGDDGTVRLWNRQGFPLVEPLRGHQGKVYCVAISADGQTIVSGGSDSTMRLWNHQGLPLVEPFRSHDVAKHFPGDGVIISITISADGQTIVSGGADGTVRLWNRQGLPLAEPFRGHQHIVMSVAISGDGQTIVSGGGDGTVRLWKRQGLPLAEPFRGHEGSVNSVAISADGQTVVSSNHNEGKVRLWNRQGLPLAEPFRDHKNYVNSVAISADGQTIVSGSPNGTVQLWNLQGLPLTEPLHDQGWVNSVAISADGQTIISGGGDGTVRLWNHQGLSLAEPLHDHQGKVNSVAISANGQTIVSGGDQGTVRLWNLQGLPLVQRLRGHQGKVTSVAISADGQTIVSGGHDGTMRLWNCQGLHSAKPSRGHENYVNSVAISVDGQTIVSGGDDGKVWLWNNYPGLPLAKPLHGHKNYVNSVAISADEQTIVSGGDDGKVWLWNRQGVTLAEPLRGHEGVVNSVAISVDGQMIVSGGDDGTVRLWNRQGVTLAEPLRGHEGVVNSVAISVNGQMIVSGGDDGTVRLWNRQGVTLAEPLRGHEGSVNSVAISADGQTIVSGGADGTVRLWRGGWRAWLQVCCDRLRYHPIFTNPETEEAKAACEVCRKYVWSKEEVKSGD